MGVLAKKNGKPRDELKHIDRPCRFRIEGYDAYSAKKIIRHNEDKIDDDYHMITYAREKGMIIITNDGRVGQDCRKVGIQCVVLDDEDLYGIVKGQLADLGRSKQGQS